MAKIALDILRGKVVATLQKSFAASDAERIADYLLWAEMSGIPTQGLIKMTGSEPLQDITPQHEIRVERDTALSQLINAGGNPSPLASQIATDTVIDKAKQHGFGIVGVHNTYSSNGAQAFYAERIANAGLIGIVLARSPAAVSAFGGIDPIFGTNPIGFSFPTIKEPLVFDMATSAMTFYGLILAKARGDHIPSDMAVDKNGELTIDPVAAMDGALLPFDRGYKGSGLGMVVEVLAGPLVGAAYGQVEGEWGALFIAISPDLLIDTADFKTACSDLLNKITSARTQPDTDVIRLPGQRARAAWQQVQETGIVDIEDTTLSILGYL